VKYEMRLVPAHYTSAHEVDVWEILKVPGHGDCYLIATFDNESLARWCYDSLRASLEWKAGEGEI
jgi:hypothetical protein